MELNTAAKKNIGLAGLYFLLSTVITWYFIKKGASLYHFDSGKMILSCSIAGAKWGLQIIAATFFLPEKRWRFIRNIAFTCLVGSVILLPYTAGLLSMVAYGFLYSLVASVITMIISYYFSVRRAGVSLRWYFFWLCCLAAAISLQLTVVFHVLPL